MQSATDEDLIVVHIVDDDPAQLAELAACAEAASRVVHRYRCGTELLDALYAEDDPAIVVADLQMPDMSGWAVASAVQKLRARGRPVGFIMVTGFPENADVRRALLLQIDDFLQKPVAGEDLLDALCRVKQLILRPASKRLAELKLSTFGDVASAFFHLFDVCDRRLPSAVRSEPHLRMILFCIARHLSGRPTSVSSTCYASGVPLSTAMRRLQELVDAGLFDKSEDANDRRRVSLRPTARLLERMESIANVANAPGSNGLDQVHDVK